jgi:hypothetical protein
MEKSKYSIQKRVDNKKQFFDLVKDGEILFTSLKYSEVVSITKSPYGLDCTDEEIENNLWNEKNGVTVDKENELEEKYERPGTAVDMLIVLLMISSIVGFFILGGEYRLSDGSLITGIVVLLVQLILMGTILTSRKIDRALLDRLDEVEKKLDMYKKIKEGKK